MSKFFNELKRRHVIKSAIAYMVVAWVILQVGSLLLDIFNSPNWVQQALTIFLIIGLPIWLVISWIYDFTPRGFEKTIDASESPEDQLIAQVTSKRLNTFIIISLSMAVVLLIIRPSFFSSDANKDYLIAVLPFDNIKVDQDKEWVSQNFAQNINSYISKVQKLKVIDSYSARQFKDSDKSNNEIAKELAVSHILRGGVTQINDHLHITIELIDVISNTVDWSESYDEKLGDDFMRLQQEISQKIVAQLKVVLNQSDVQALDNLLTNNQEASIYFNEGLRIADDRNGVNNDSILIESANLFQKAIDLDPNYADAYAEMAFVLRLVSDSDPFFEKTDKLKTVDSLTKIALNINPNTPRAYTVLGAVEFMWKNNWNKAKEYLDKALAIKPNDATTHQYYAIYFSTKPEPDAKKSFEHAMLAHKLNPFSNPIGFGVIIQLLTADKIMEAEAFYKKNSHVFPVNGKRISVMIIDAKIKKESIEKKNWTEAIKLYHSEIESDSLNSILYNRLAEAYNHILRDEGNYILYAKKAYDLGAIDGQNQSESGFSENAYSYLISLLKGKQFEEAYALLQSPYFKSLMQEYAQLMLRFDYYYYSENYDQAAITADRFIYDEKFDLSKLYAQINDINKLNPILYTDALLSYQKAIVFAILKEKDSMYYYMDKENTIENVFLINGSIELDAYRKENRYKAFLKKNYLPIAQRNK